MDNWSDLKYLTGFGSHFSSEALAGALPKVGNNPQRCPYGLYCECLTGTTFTTPRAKNQRSWLYRITPSVKHRPFQKIDKGFIVSNFEDCDPNPNQIRWDVLPYAKEPTDFVQGIVTWMGNGSAASRTGLAIHLYTANRSMENKAFYNADGDLLIVPSEGPLKITTEFGLIDLKIGEICVIQRGIKFSVTVEGPSRGYICEVFQGHFILPDLGPIGSNGLANSRDFESPVAWYEDKDCEFELTQKFLGDIFSTKLDHSPFDVVAWHGDYVPYKYDLKKFCAVGSISYDHLDPSIFTVLTCPTNEPGVAVCDFLLFAPRWLAMNDTFRPPWFHRNTAAEYNGSIRRQDRPLPYGGSLHNVMIGHGMSADILESELNCDLTPVHTDPKQENDLDFMLESIFPYKLTKFAAKNLQQKGAYKRWDGIKKSFDKNWTPKSKL